MSKNKIIPASHPKIKVRPRFEAFYNKYFWHVLCVVDKCEFYERRETHNGAHKQAAIHRREHKKAFKETL